MDDNDKTHTPADNSIYSETIEHTEFSRVLASQKVTPGIDKDAQESDSTISSQEQLQDDKAPKMVVNSIFKPSKEDEFLFKDRTPPGRFGWTEKIWIPIGVGLIGLTATIAGTILGVYLTNLQDRIAKEDQAIQKSNAKAAQIIERAGQASSERQTVLSNYAERITNLISENGLVEFDASSPDKRAIWNAIRGETIIALKRLDDTSDQPEYEGLGEVDVLKAQLLEVWSSTNSSSTQSNNDSQQSQLSELEGFNDSGELKGELVRFLYEAKLLGGVNESDPEASLLRGADLTRVVLTDAPLPEINLRRAWIPWGQLNNAKLPKSDLRGAELRQANLGGATLSEVNLGWATLQQADLTEADLQAATLTSANLANANLTRADLSNANLLQASLENADLSSANLQGADLRGADLHGVKLEDTDLTGACYHQDTTRGLENINLERLDMRNVSGVSEDVACSDLFIDIP